MDLNLDKIEKLAKKATPGPWSSDMNFGVRSNSKLNSIGEPLLIANECLFNDGEYIAAVSPNVVLALVELISELEKNQK